jgi:tRNA threonylcarbamoyl adenosine modification protein (Sua5/YciO/YrdC/YwlC family)
MATRYKIHPQTPQKRKIEAIQTALRQGAVMLYPTDTVYALGCDLQAKSAVQRVRQLKQLANEKPLTFLCSSLSNIADYARVSDPAYRLIRRLIPGPYTFLLPATKQVPRLVMNPKRRTTGIRVPDDAICQALLAALNNPIISTSALSLLQAPSRSASQVPNKFDLFDQLEAQVDVIIDDDLPLRYDPSTIVTLAENDVPTILRQGLGWETAVDQGAVISTEPSEPLLAY